MKRLCGLLMTLLMVVSMVGCSSKSTTGTSTAKGFGGDVTVTVTLDGDKIIDVKASGEAETPEIGGRALEELPKKMIEANSTDVEIVSGATVTSNAVISAAKAAVSAAKGETSAISFNPGTYSGEAYGNISTIKVDVTVSESKIEKIEVVSQGETPVLYDAAKESVLNQIIDGQTLAVDAVTGASVTSNALVAAVSNALEKSGCDLNALKVVREKEKVEVKHVEKQADVVVVGGGGAGLVAAISAAEQGANVIVLEKAPFLGGNLVVFGGIYNTPDPELQSKVEMKDSIHEMIEKAISAEPVNEEHAQAMAEVKQDYETWQANGAVGLFDSAAWYSLQTWNSGDKVANKKLVDLMCDNAFEGYEWLKDIGVEFNDKVTQGAGSLYQRTHGAVKPNGSGFIEAYVNTLDQYDTVEIMMETSGKALIKDDAGRIVGVEAEDVLGNTYSIKAENGVILATGGFAGNVELRQEYCEGDKWEDLGPNVMTTNLKSITGDGILMAREIGANLIDMEQIQLLHLGNPFNGSTKGVIPSKGRNANEVIFVNSEGKRFVAEDGRRDVMCNAILQQPGSFYWMIHDSKNIDLESPAVSEFIKGGYMVMADTLEELAALIDVDPTTLIETVNQYNEAVVTGKDELTGRSLLEVTIDEGPYFAAKRVPSAHHTMGGIEINEETHVLDEEGNWIEGLYAAGEVTGGIHGGNRVGGNAVDDTVVFGRIAGANAAKAE